MPSLSDGLALALPLLAAGVLGWVLGRRRQKPPVRLATESYRTGVARETGPESPAARLRALLAERRLVVMPCCYDGLSARLVEQAGFELTFMTGFGVSAKNGFADCQLVSYQEMLDSAFQICGALDRICCIGDGDTGYGNAVNVKRTVKGYAQAGMAGIMIEDQVAPKRCGHTQGTTVVPRQEALARVKAACDARDEGARDICIMARTDARATLGLEEALERCRAFQELGADITFLEAPRSEEEMARYCREVPGHKMVNMLPSGKTPMLSHERLEELGFAIAAYPLTLLSAGIKAQQAALQGLKRTGSAEPQLELDFGALKEVVGFSAYYREEERYRT
ncbi:unnamed protein product [Effrenium voratum]|nr:unnamed protein product [Effrenium voratum]